MAKEREFKPDVKNAGLGASDLSLFDGNVIGLGLLFEIPLRTSANRSFSFKSYQVSGRLWFGSSDNTSRLFRKTG